IVCRQTDAIGHTIYHDADSRASVPGRRRSEGSTTTGKRCKTRSNYLPDSKRAQLVRSSQLGSSCITAGHSTHIGSTKAADLDANGFVGLGTHLDILGEATIKQRFAAEFGSSGNTVQLVLQLNHFVVQSLTLGITITTVGGLQSQVTHPLQNGGGLLQSTFSGLRQGDTVVGVTHRNVQTVDLAGQTVGNLQTCGVILGAVDARTGRQTLQGGGQVAGRSTQVTLGVQRSNVAVYCKGHG